MAIPFLPTIKPRWTPARNLTKIYGSTWAWFRPSLSPLNIWQDSAGSTAVTAAAQSVGKIVSIDGSASSAIQATTANKPTYYTDARNVPVLRHDTTDGLTVTTPAEFSGALGPELVTNGGFDSDTAWTKGTNWAISGGTAIKTNDAVSSDIDQTITTVIGKAYLLQFTCTAIGGASYTVKFKYNGIYGSDIRVTGTHNLVIVADRVSNVVGVRSFAGTATIDNFTVREAPSLASLYYANQWGVTQTHGIPIYDSYALPGKPGSSTADVYEWILVPSRPDGKTESEIVKWLTKTAGL